jgi:hypothetical protein
MAQGELSVVFLEKKNNIIATPSKTNGGLGIYQLRLSAINNGASEHLYVTGGFTFPKKYSPRNLFKGQPEAYFKNIIYSGGIQYFPEYVYGSPDKVKIYYINHTLATDASRVFAEVATDTNLSTAISGINMLCVGAL